MRQQIGTVRFGATTIGYSIRWSSNRSTIAVTVHPDGVVSVVAPTEIPNAEIAEVVAKKAEWILQQQEYFRRQHNGYVKQFVSGESFFYLGRQYKLKVKQVETAGQTSRVQLVRGQFFVAVPSTIDFSARASAVRNGLIQWYRDKASEHIPRMAALFSGRLGLPYTTVQVREMKQRWGSARTNGRVSFNWRIIMAPRRLVEYVVAHELCHLKYNNHSQDFWRLLERAMPDYAGRRIELATVGPKFDLPQISLGAATTARNGSPRQSPVRN